MAAHVVVLESLNEDIFICGFCKQVFNTLHLFLAHKKKIKCNEQVSVNEEVFQQDYTKSIGNDKLSISFDKNNIPNNNPVTCTQASNVDQESAVKQISCKVCNKKFKKMKTLLMHLKTHNESPYQCPICGRCFGQNSNLQRHILTHKVWPDSFSDTTPKSSDVDLLSYSCSYCESNLCNYNQFRAHLKSHMSLKKFRCMQGECIVLFENVDGLLQHVTTAHEYQSYVCHKCSEKFYSLEEIAKHQENHVESAYNSKPPVIEYKCSLCDATFKKSEKLSLHMLTENHNKTCIHCNKVFTSDKRLRLHLQTHRKLKLFPCNICGSSFHMKKYLMSHMLKHSEGRFLCSVCKFKFKRSDLLRRHMKTHQLRKSLKCPFKDTLNCKMEFNRSDKLKSHVKYHTKRMIVSNVTSKTSQETSGTVEICILPLDS